MVTGFGHQILWNKAKIIPKGCQMSMNKAFHIVCTSTFIRILFPDWILKLMKRLDSIRIAFEELQVQISHYSDIDMFFHHSISVDVYVWNDWWMAKFQHRTSQPLQQLDSSQRWYDKFNQEWNYRCIQFLCLKWLQLNLDFCHFEGSIYIFLLTGHEVCLLAENT